MFLLLVLNVFSLKIQLKPETGTPPAASISSAVVYSPLNEKIYAIGGNEPSEDKVISDIYSFDLKQNKWSFVPHFSDLKPSYLENHQAYLRNNREILIFSHFSEVYIFNIETNGWRTEKIIGDQFGSIASYSMAVLNYNSTDYVAIFGGLMNQVVTNKLFL